VLLVAGRGPAGASSGVDGRATRLRPPLGFVNGMSRISARPRKARRRVGSWFRAAEQAAPRICSWNGLPQSLQSPARVPGLGCCQRGSGVSSTRRSRRPPRSFNPDSTLHSSDAELCRTKGDRDHESQEKLPARTGRRGVSELAWVLRSQTQVSSPLPRQTTTLSHASGPRWRCCYE
jgi:hypothetical protein